MKKVLIFLTTITLLISAISLAYGFYADNKTKTSPQIGAITSTSDLTVDSFAALKICATDSVYNNKFAATDKNNRRKLKLSENITLSGDITITADISLDFAEKLIDLNGFNLTIRHNYDGEFNLYKIYVLDSSVGESGTFTIITPNALPILSYSSSNEIIPDIIEFSTETFASTLAADAYSLVEKTISYGETSNYFHSDIDLPFNYYSYKNVTFEYESSNEDLLDNKGKVTANEYTNTQVTLSVQLKIDGSSYGNKKSYEINIIGKENAQGWANAGIKLFENYFDKYKNVSLEEYVIYNDVMLLSTNDYININSSLYYDYEVYLSKDEQGNLSEPLVNNIYELLGNKVLKSDRGILYLKVTSNLEDGDEQIVSDFEVYKITVAYYSDLYDYLNEILTEHFRGGIIDINEITAGVYDSFTLPKNINEFNPKYNITKIEYKLLSYNSYYTKIDYVDYEELVVKDQEPDPLSNEFLQISITFGETEIKALATITYIKSGTSFEPYYKHIHNLIGDATNKTYVTFTELEFLSSYYGSQTGPQIKYELTQVKFVENAYVEDTEKNDIGSSGGIDDNLTSNSNMAINLVLAGNGNYKININLTKMPKYDVIIQVKYLYKFPSSIWTPYEQNYTYITVKGLVHKDNDDVTNKPLFDALYGAYAGERGDYTGEKFIFIHELAAPKDSFTFIPTASVSSYKGIELITGTKKLKLGDQVVTHTGNTSSGPFKASYVNDSDLDYIAQLTQLEHLEIIGPYYTSGPSNAKHITNLSKFMQLTNLKQIWLPYNKILDFSSIGNFKAPIEIFIYQNLSTSWIKINGSEGFISTINFSLAIQRNGGTDVFKIYNKISSNTPQIFSEGTLENSWKYVSQVMYQNKVENGAINTSDFGNEKHIDAFKLNAQVSHYNKNDAGVNLPTNKQRLQDKKTYYLWSFIPVQKNLELYVTAIKISGTNEYEYYYEYRVKEGRSSTDEEYLPPVRVQLEITWI